MSPTITAITKILGFDISGPLHAAAAPGLDRRSYGGLAENGRPRHEGVRSRAPRCFNSAHGDTAIDLQHRFRAAPIEQGSRASDLRRRSRQVALSPESRIDAHEQQQIEIGHDFFHQRQRTGGIQGETCLHPPFANLGQVPLHMDRRFRMEGEDIHPEVGILADVVLRLDDHQVHVQYRVGELPQCPDERCAEGQVRDKAAVHHVDVQPVRAAGKRGLDLLA
jgi:hypothetical protein